MFSKTLLGCLTLVMTTALAAGAEATEATGWPQWRGPKRDGVSTDVGLLKQWPKTGPTLVWDAKGAGRGYASIALAGGRLYTMGDGPSTANDKAEYALCFDAADGKQVWHAKLGDAWNGGKPDWQSSRSTPTVDGELVYFLEASGNLVCLETAMGKERWRKSMQKDFGGKKADSWGYSESVLIDGDRLVCTPGGDKSTIVALDKKTGSLLWTAIVPNDRGAGHASPVIAEVGGNRVYVQMTGSGAVGVRPNDGKVLWTYPIDKTTAVIPTPIVRGDLVFFSAGYKRGGALLKQVPGTDGSVKIQEVYGLKTALANKHGGVVLVGDYVYGDSEDQGNPWCAELMTGKVKWTRRDAKGKTAGKGSAAISYADGNLYVNYADGTLALVKAAPDNYEEVSSFKIPHSGDRPSWSHSIITGGKLYFREGDHVLCYDLRSK